MKDQFKSSQSITSFAQRNARKLSFRVFIIGFTSTFFLSLGIGTYYYQRQLDQTLELISKTLSQPLALGGNFLPAQIINTLTSSGNFKNVWINLPDGSTQLESHKTPNNQSIAKIKNDHFYWSNKAPNILISKNILYNNNIVGNIYAGYEIPIGTILGYAFFICLLFSVIAFYLYLKILSLAKNVAIPFKNYSSQLDESVDKEMFLRTKNNKQSFSEIMTLNKILLNYIEKNKINESIAKKAVSKAQTDKIAIRVKHDVLASLLIGQSALDTMKENGQDTDAIKTVFERISNTVSDIQKIGNLTDTELKLATLADDTLEKDSWRSCHLTAFVYQIVGEVKFSNLCQNKDITFDISCDSLGFEAFSEIEPNKFKRDLLNLYKNATESIDSKGTINTLITQKNQFISIEISDTGSGIPKEILPKIGKRGHSYNKNNGTGIGLSSAIEDIERWNGKLNINSTINIGTSIEILLPQSEKNILLPTSLTLEEDMTVLVVDDDPLVHTIWKNKFEKINTKDNINTMYAYNLEMAQNIIKNLEQMDRDYILLIDNDLKHKELTGFEFVKKMKLQARSILVTSSGNSERLYEKCRQINLPVIPKCIQEQISIVI